MKGMALVVCEAAISANSCLVMWEAAKCGCRMVVIAHGGGQGGRVVCRVDGNSDLADGAVAGSREVDEDTLRTQY